MILSYFKQLKEAEMVKDLSLARDIERAKPYIILSDLLDLSGVGKLSRQGFREIMRAFPFRSIFIEFAEAKASVGVGDWTIESALVKEEKPDHFSIQCRTSGGDKRFTIFLPETKDSSIHASWLNPDTDFSLPSTENIWRGIITTFICASVKAITDKTSRLGHASHVKRVFGKVKPYMFTYVKQVNTVYPNSSKAPQVVEWKHSWWVAGCWVKIHGIGKDRDGIRKIDGLTWRVPHIKGDGELLEKVRVLARQKP